ncbi:hypothetical protein INT45_005412 [Circinella minor]|uniref:Ndc10 domain-containing protein n=1 Tax=Circinella minor TaxID=1195481 RepID=A0A8H7VCS1_9FUNG|nr:hypothetical protein INT45_005412 [Circinella minor]
MNPQHSINEINTTPTVPADTRPMKRAHGRPKKTNQQDLNSITDITSASMALNSHTNVSVTNANSLRDLSELDTALENFCDENMHRFNTDPEYPYTVGPPELVIAFFKEFVFKHTYTKYVAIGSDVRTQIYLRNDNEPSSSATLPQLTEAAPFSRDGKAKMLIVPLSYESNMNAALSMIRQLIKILKSLSTANSKSGLREMFSISARHHMLLRDQDLRNLNFADCFCTIIPKKQHRGTQQVVGLVFCLDKGKTLKEGEVKFACAIRHENVFRCPVGAFAFLMFSLLQDNGEFLNEDRWHNWKVLRGRDDPEKSLSGTQQYKTAKNAFAEHDVFTTRVTHGGRHAGAIEAEALGIPFDLIKRGGGWKDRLGRLETHYLGKLPSQFARGMAGSYVVHIYHNKAFHLPRNNASPSLELQRMIFPWIEDYFGSENEAWKIICEKEMREVDENEDDGISDNDDDENNNVEFVEENRRMVQGNGQRKENSVVSSKLLDDPKYNPFISMNFKEFQEEVVNAINRPSVNRLQEYEGLVPNIVDSQIEVSNRLSEINYKLTRDQQKNNDRLNTIENSLNKNHQDSSRIESILLGLSQQLQQVSYSQQILLTN